MSDCQGEQLARGAPRLCASSRTMCSSRQLALGLLLLALAAGPASCQDTQAVECRVAEADGSTSTFYPGPFQPEASTEAAAASGAEGAACPDPRQVPTTSKAPFFLGTATAAYQVEGAAAEGGRTPSIWDTFSHIPGKTANGDNGDVADDFYHRYPADIELMRRLGLRNFRLSLSWTRLLPGGRGEVNQEGVAFYNSLINALKAACIEPYITLYHWDLPQALHDQYRGWLDPQIVTDFTAYAQTAFGLFGDRVKTWFTLNEPETYCHLGYNTGTHAPGRCSDRSRCPEGDSDLEPHLCAYHSLLAHASAVQAFRQLVPDGKIGITSALNWAEPFTSNAQDTAAAERQQSYMAGYFLDPIYRGDWPAERKTVHGANLPAFTPEQQQLLQQNKQDFIAVQHYTGNYVYENAVSGGPLSVGFTSTSADGVTLPVADSDWLLVFPRALRSLLRWLSQRYSYPDILVTENGVSAPGESSKPVDEVLCDQFRLAYFQQYIGNATEAVRQDGVKLQGYFAWSMLDNFEWADGYSKRFGVVYVDYATQTRFFKASSLWLASWFGLTPSSGSSDSSSSGSDSGSGDGSSGSGGSLPASPPLADV